MDQLVVSNLLLPKLSEPGEICIYHPGYEDEDEPLLTLTGCDTATGGLWREVAETACAIISNSFDGHLKNEHEIVTTDILQPGNYWWHLPDSKYPIIPYFRLWPFPNPPAIWRTRTRDIQDHCCLTKQSIGKENAHIIPRFETEWFVANRMGRFGRNRYHNVDHEDNIMPLRSDIHTALDMKVIAFFPKKDKVVLHSMEPEMARHQNAPLQQEVCREYLLARFAWTLFPRSINPWLMRKKPRMLWMEVKGKLTAREVSGDECWNIACAPRPASTSPKKRKLTDVVLSPPTGSNSKLHYTDLDSGLGSTDDDDLVGQSEENDRGRKRLRGDYRCTK